MQEKELNVLELGDATFGNAPLIYAAISAKCSDDGQALAPFLAITN